MNTLDLSPYSILIAEDNENNYKFYQSSLKKTGAALLHASNGKEAVNMFLDNPAVNLIIMDAMMPEMDGFTATRKIKQINPGVPVIMMTAYANHETIIESVSSGCNDYLSKPITRDILYAAIKKWLPAH